MAQIAKVRCNFWYEHKIYKFINRTFAKENLHWYNLSIKGGFAMNNTLFEQFGVTYTQQSDYLLPNLILPAEKETGYIGVWGQRRLNYLKHLRKVLYYNLLTSGKLRACLPILVINLLIKNVKVHKIHQRMFQKAFCLVHVPCSQYDEGLCVNLIFPILLTLE